MFIISMWDWQIIAAMFNSKLKYDGIEIKYNHSIEIVNPVMNNILQTCIFFIGEKVNTYLCRRWLGSNKL